MRNCLIIAILFISGCTMDLHPGANYYCQDELINKVTTAFEQCMKNK